MRKKTKPKKKLVFKTDNNTAKTKTKEGQVSLLEISVPSYLKFTERVSLRPVL